jgi:hypothetical protein
MRRGLASTAQKKNKEKKKQQKTTNYARGPGRPVANPKKKEGGRTWEAACVGWPAEKQNRRFAPGRESVVGWRRRPKKKKYGH